MAPCLLIAFLLIKGGVTLPCSHNAAGKLVVSSAQWEKVKTAVLTHDPAQIAPFVSDATGLLETSILALYPKEKPFVHQEDVSKAKLLKEITKIPFYDGSGTVGPYHDAVFAWTWVSLFDSKSKRIRLDTWEAT